MIIHRWRQHFVWFPDGDSQNRFLIELRLNVTQSLCVNTQPLLSHFSFFELAEHSGTKKQMWQAWQGDLLEGQPALISIVINHVFAY